MSIYKYGSKVTLVITVLILFYFISNLNKNLFEPLAYINSTLNVPSLEWIGLKLSDLDRFRLENRQNFEMPLNQIDIRLATNLIKRLEDLEEFDLKQEVVNLFFNFFLIMVYLFYFFLILA